jgi:trk system potassium uptake protein TrkA
MKVVIAGAGAVGGFVAADLKAAGHDVLLIERSAALVAKLRPSSEVDLFLGDACEVSTLDEAGIADADVMVAATGEDQVNLVISLLAKQEFAVPRVVARINEPRNKWLFNETWGVDVSVSTPHLLTALIEEAVSVGSLVRLLEFGGGEAQLIEVTLADDSPADGRSILELGVPRDASIVAIVREGHVVVPRGDTIIQRGDEVLALTTPASEDAVKRLLVGDTADGRRAD